MTLADILAAVGEVMDPTERETQIRELLTQENVDLEQLRSELNARAQELIDIGPDDMTEEQIAECHIIAQILALIDEVESQSNDSDDSSDSDSSQDSDSQQDSTGSQDERSGRARSATEALSRASTTRNNGSNSSGNDSEQSMSASAPGIKSMSAAGLDIKKTRPTVPLSNVDPAPSPSNGINNDPRRVRHTVIAAGDLPGYRASTELSDMQAISAAVHTGMSQVSRSQTPGLSQGLATIKRDAPDHLSYRSESDWRKVDAVTEQKNLPGSKGLTAAGGWCAPSEVLYDTCPITVSSDGMIDLPTITSSRGGIKYSGRPDFGSIWRNVGFMQTETDAIAGVLKPCWEIPCPDDLRECRMDISGICLKQPILTERGWPEKVEEFVEYAMLAHAHKMNAEKIRRMVDLATYQVEVPAPANPQDASIFDPHGPGAFESVLSMLELQVEFLRYSGRLSRTSLLEGMAPYFLRGMLRADMSKKLGIDNRWDITDELLDRYLLLRGIRFQWVYDWQDALAEMDDSAFGGSVPTQWPSQVQILIYEPGTYFALQQDVITLSGIYDSVDLQKNVYTRLFTEEGWQVCTRCGQSVLLTFNLCPNGLSGTQQRTHCDALVPA